MLSTFSALLLHQAIRNMFMKSAFLRLLPPLTLPLLFPIHIQFTLLEVHQNAFQLPYLLFSLPHNTYFKSYGTCNPHLLTTYSVQRTNYFQHPHCKYQCTKK